jgi:hypothetical protein
VSSVEVYRHTEGMDAKCTLPSLIADIPASIVCLDFFDQITEGQSSEPDINDINELSVHIDDVRQERILLFDESRHSVVPHVLPLPRRCVDAWITVRLYEFAATD